MDRRLTRVNAAVYLAIGAFAIALVGSILSGIRPIWSSLALPGICAVGMAGLSAYYTFRRPEPRLARGLGGISWILLFTLAGGYLTYLAAAVGLPFQDRLFAGLDAALGFDWVSLMKAVDASPASALVLSLAYQSSKLQIVVIFIAIGLMRTDDRLWEFLSLYAVTALAVVAIAALLPAFGAYPYHLDGLNFSRAAIPLDAGIWHMNDVNALRAGTLTAIDLTTIQGIVTFPSFHTALAVVCVWSVRGIRFLFPAFLLLNAVVIVSTLPIGGHYLVDVIAGAAIAMIAIAVERRLFSAARSAVPALGKPATIASMTRI